MKTISSINKNMVVAVLALVVVGGLYLIHAGPARRAIARQRETVNRLNLDLAWMKKGAVRVGGMRGKAAAVVADSLLTLVDRTVGDAGIRSAVRKVAADGDKSVRVWFGEVRFAAFASWLAKIGASGLTVRECRVNEREGGMVRAEVRLVGKK